MTERFNFICPSPEQLETNVGIELLLGTECVPIVFFKNFSNRFAGPPFQPIHFLKIIELIFKLEIPFKLIWFVYFDLVQRLRIGRIVGIQLHFGIDPFWRLGNDRWQMIDVVWRHNVALIVCPPSGFDCERSIRPHFAIFFPSRLFDSATHAGEIDDRLLNQTTFEFQWRFRLSGETCPSVQNTEIFKIFRKWVFLICFLLTRMEWGRWLRLVNSIFSDCSVFCRTIGWKCFAVCLWSTDERPVESHPP